VAVQPQREVIQRVAHVRQPLGVPDHAVGEVAVHDPQAAAVGQAVHRLVADADAAEVQADELAAELIVIAGHVDDLRALARLAQHLLHDVVVRLRPEQAFFHGPAVDDVADQVQHVGLMMTQEVQQMLGLAAARTQVRVGNEDRAVVAPVPRRRCIGGCRRCGARWSGRGAEEGSDAFERQGGGRCETTDAGTIHGHETLRAINDLRVTLMGCNALRRKAQCARRSPQRVCMTA